MTAEPPPIETHEEMVTIGDLRRFAGAYGLVPPLLDRCSDVFLLELYGLHRAYGVNPRVITEEVTALDCGDRARRGTKKAERFRHAALAGLWKKHFFSVHFMPQNLLLAWENGALNRIIWEELDKAKAPPEESQHEHALRISHAISRRAVQEAFLARSKAKKLTGEWVVFAKHATGNHYLTIGRHGEGDSAIRDRVVRGVVPQFPWIGNLLSVGISD